MSKPSRGVFRLALIALMGLSASTSVRAAGPMEQTLPEGTYLYIKAADISALKDSIGKTQFAQLFADPAWNALKEDLKGKLEEGNNELKQRVGFTLAELLAMPQGQITLAIVNKDDPKLPIAALLSVDAGKNDSKLEGVLNKITQQLEQEGNKVSNESYKSVTLHVVRFSQEKDEEKSVPFPLVWTKQGTVFHLGTDVDAVKDILSGAKRETSLATTEQFMTITKKLGKDPQVLWYVDLAGALKKGLAFAGAQDGGGNIQQFEPIINMLGIGGLKAIGGATWYNTGNYDRLFKAHLLTSAPQGILKLFPTPKSALKPEPWVPATVSTYQSFNWDLDAAWASLTELANMFQPGAIAEIEKRFAGPDGKGELKFDKDIFGPLGDRITVISDYQKPITEKSQRLLFAIALEDSKAFQSTLGKIIEQAKLHPKKREFQGTTIFDFEIGEVPNSPTLQGPISVAIAKNTLFISIGPSLLEQVLRGGPALADNPSYQTVAKEFPAETSGITYIKPEEQLRQLYDMIKSGKIFENAAAPGAPKIEIDKVLDVTKIPDFNVIAKYLSQGGSYMIQEEDGLSVTGFMLHKSTP